MHHIQSKAHSKGGLRINFSWHSRIWCDLGLLIKVSSVLYDYWLVLRVKQRCESVLRVIYCVDSKVMNQHIASEKKMRLCRNARALKGRWLSHFYLVGLATKQFLKALKALANIVAPVNQTIAEYLPIPYSGMTFEEPRSASLIGPATMLPIPLLGNFAVNKL